MSSAVFLSMAKPLADKRRRMRRIRKKNGILGVPFTDTW
jgi:hypothetical protein